MITFQAEINGFFTDIDITSESFIDNLHNYISKMFEKEYFTSVSIRILNLDKD